MSSAEWSVKTVTSVFNFFVLPSNENYFQAHGLITKGYFKITDQPLIHFNIPSVALPTDQPHFEGALQ